MTSRARRREQLLIKALSAVACHFRRVSWLLTANKAFISSCSADFAGPTGCGQLLGKALLAAAWWRGREAYMRGTVSEGVTHSLPHLGPRRSFVAPFPVRQGKRATQLLIKALLAVRRTELFGVPDLRVTANKAFTHSPPSKLLTGTLTVISHLGENRENRPFWSLGPERARQPQEPDPKRTRAPEDPEPPQIQTSPRTSPTEPSSSRLARDRDPK